MRAFIILLLLAGMASLIAYGAGGMIDTDRVRIAIEQNVESGTAFLIESDGGADITWLPRPRVSLRALEVSSANPALPDLGGTIDRVDLSLDPLSLLLGKVEIDGIRIVRPRLIVPDDRVMDWSAMAIDPGRLAAIDDAILVLGGEIVTAGGETLLENLDLEIDRIAETGAVAATGKAMAGPTQLSLRADSIVHEESDGGPLTVHLDLAEEDRSLAAAFVGSWSVAGPPIALAGRIEVASEEGAEAARAGSDQRASRGAVAPGLLARVLAPPLFASTGFSLSGQVRLEPGRVRLEGGLLRTVIGDAEILFNRDAGTAPGFDLEIKASRLDLAAIAADREHAMVWQDLPSGLVGRVRASASEVTGSVLGAMNDVAVDLLLPGGGSVAVERFVAGLPGGGQVRAGAARLVEGGEPVWSGSARLHVMEPPPSFAPILERIGLGMAKLRTIGLETGFVATRASLALNDLSLAFDASRARGQIVIFRDPAPRVVLDLEIDRLEPARYLSGAWLEDGVGSTLDRIAADLANEVSLSAEIAVGRVQAGPYSASDLRLRIDFAERALTIKEFALGSLGAARIAALGSMRPDERAFDLAFDVEMPSVARFLRALGAPTGPRLSLVGSLRGSGVATGTLDGAVIDAAIESEHGLATLEAELEGPPDRPRIDARVTAAAPNFATVLRRFAGLSRPLDVLDGPMALEMEVTHLAGAGPSSWTIHGDLGGMRLDLDATRVAGSGAEDRPWAGRLDLTRFDTALLRDLRRLSSDLVTQDLEGGAVGWSRDPLSFTRLLPEAMSIAWDLDIGLERDGAALGNLLALVKADAKRLSVDLREVPIAGGTLAGSLALASAEVGQGALDLDLSLALRDADAETLLAATDRPSPFRSTISLDLDAQSEGGSAHELAGNLRGQGRLVASDGEIDPGEPASLLVPDIRQGTDHRSVLWTSYGRKAHRAPSSDARGASSPAGLDEDALAGPRGVNPADVPGARASRGSAPRTAASIQPAVPADGGPQDDGREGGNPGGSGPEGSGAEGGGETVRFSTLKGDFFIEDGLALTGDAPLRLEGPALQAAVDVRFDLLDRSMDMAIHDETTGASRTLRLVGPARAADSAPQGPRVSRGADEGPDTSD